MEPELPIEQLENLYGWVDELPLSRPKKNIHKDFSDGILMVELLEYYFPRLVQRHNYTAGSSRRIKEDNWRVLNKKVLYKHLGYELSDDDIINLCNATSGTIERVLMDVRRRIDQKLRPEEQPQSFRKKLDSQRESDKPEADQNIGAQRQNKIRTKSKGSGPDILAPPFEKITNANLNRIDAPSRPAALKPKQEMSKKDMAELNHKFREKEQELLAKDELIAVLQAKVLRLEHLIQLKDMRLNELQAQFEELRPTGNYK